MTWNNTGENDESDLEGGDTQERIQSHSLDSHSLNRQGAISIRGAHGLFTLDCVCSADPSKVYDTDWIEEMV